MIPKFTAVTHTPVSVSLTNSEEPEYAVHLSLNSNGLFASVFLTCEDAKSLGAALMAHGQAWEDERIKTLEASTGAGSSASEDLG